SSMPASTSSLTALAFAPGALNTGTPRPLIAATGMLLVPAPARAIARTDRGIVVECRSAERSRIASGEARSGPTAYRGAGSSASPLSEIWFSTSTRIGSRISLSWSAVALLELAHVVDERPHAFDRH